MPSIYFAGPDVFRRNYDQIVLRIQKLCALAGLTPLLPGDGESSDSLTIFHRNIELIQAADGIVANLNPFRGPVEPDSGTVFECGYGFALGKFVIGVVQDQRDLMTKLTGGEPGPRPLTLDGFMVEDFGHPLNLMVTHCLSATVRTLEEAVAEARARSAIFNVDTPSSSNGS